MGGALLAGWLREGLDPTSVYVQDPTPSPEAAALMASHGIRVRHQAKLPTAPAVIVFAVKPQIIDEVLPTLASAIGPSTVLLSIAAGRTLANLASHLPQGTAVVRAMPNTPAAIGQGMTVACASPEVTRDQALRCNTLLEAVGDVIWMDDESQIDAVTAVSGSGPAYVFLLAECLAEAGVEAGLDPELAARLARATVSGAGELLRRSDLSAAELRQNVTSPKGDDGRGARSADGQRRLRRSPEARRGGCRQAFPRAVVVTRSQTSEPVASSFETRLRRSSG